MLFFCEECGGKNIVPDVTSDQKIVRFRCCHCQYETVVDRKIRQDKIGAPKGVSEEPHKAGSGSRQASGS